MRNLSARAMHGTGILGLGFLLVILAVLAISVVALVDPVLFAQLVSAAAEGSDSAIVWRWLWR